jgi:hypothetical protein
MIMMAFEKLYAFEQMQNAHVPVSELMAFVITSLPPSSFFRGPISGPRNAMQSIVLPWTYSIFESLLKRIREPANLHAETLCS